MSGKPHPSNPILIVDDEAAILLSIDTALQMAGLSNTLTSGLHARTCAW